MIYFPPNENDAPPPLRPSYRNLDCEPVERDGSEHPTSRVGLGEQGSRFRALEDQVQELKDKLESQQAIIDQKDSQLHQANIQLQCKTDAYDALQKQYEEKCDLLEHRTMKLRSTEKLVMREDEVSVEEIKSELEDINSQINAIAVSCTNIQSLNNRFGILKVKRRSSRKLPKDVSVYLELLLGAKMVHALERCDYAKNGVTIAQHSMSSVMCLSIAKSAETHPFSPLVAPGDIASDIRDGYKDMHLKETQLASSLWRHLFAKYIRVGGPNRDNALQDALGEPIIPFLSCILLIAGVTDDADAIETYCEASVGPAVKTLCAAAVRLSQTLKERVFSADYVVLAASPISNSDFDEELMMQRRAGGEEPRNKRKENEKVAVLCTTKLGIYKLSKDGGVGGEPRKEAIQKAMVILERDPIFQDVS